MPLVRRHRRDASRIVAMWLRHGYRVAYFLA
jgi:hypothetical protein